MNTANNQLNTYIYFIAISIIYVRNYAKWKGWLKIKWNQIACTDAVRLPGIARPFILQYN